MLREDWDWLGAQREFDRAIQLDPHSAAAHWYMALLSMAMGHTEKALSEMIQSQRLDPASENAHDDLGWAYYLNHRFRRSRQRVQNRHQHGPAIIFRSPTVG